MAVGRQTGIVTLVNIRVIGCFNEAATDFDSRSIAFNAVSAVRCETV